VHSALAMRKPTHRIITLLLLCACSTDPATDSPPATDDDHAWPYESLTPEERAVIDHERDAAAWPAITNAFARAVRETHAREHGR
jgi:hypothetical protein